MNGWQYVIHQKALEAVDQLSVPQRRQIRTALAKLVADPLSPPDAQIRPSNDRCYSVKKVGSLYLVYWVDEFAREVRVVRVDVPP